MLDVSAVSVVIVIIAICDMPRQEFSLCEHVYIHILVIKIEKEKFIHYVNKYSIIILLKVFHFQQNS